MARITGMVLISAALLGSPALFGNRFFEHSAAHAQAQTTAAPAQSARLVLWREPLHISPDDLYYGPGGAAHRPDVHDTFKFLKEDLEGSHPKFEVQDGHGVHWKVKLGTEARPETVAARLVWAAGYAADEDYFVGEIHVDSMPAHLHRGQQLAAPHGIVRNVRLERMLDDRKKVGEWSWRENPFAGTRELNGLRVLMALINNWDVKDINNHVYEVPADAEHGTAERLYEVTDLGSSFGATGLQATDHANGNLHAYRSSAFITHLTADAVTFKTPRLPDWIVAANAPEFSRRVGLLWIGKDIPRSDARWMGSVLAQIPPDGIRGAFRAAGYTQEEADGFTTVVESRIQQLNAL
jgi:hypothetical protein